MKYRGDEIRCPYCDKRQASTSRLIAHADACAKNPWKVISKARA
jgi:hypothetical protein